jgi:hypothetical protein
VGDRPSQRCKDAFAAIIATEKKHNAARSSARILPHSKFAWKECPLTVITDALPAILKKSQTILEGDWFDRATKAELREVVDNALAAERKKLVQQVKREMLYESDVFPTDKSRRCR